MPDAPSVTSVELRIAAIVRITVARADMPKVMGPGIVELTEALRAGPCSAGAMFAHNLPMDAAVFGFKVKFPSEWAVVAVGRVRPGSLPASVVARATNCGGYEDLSAAWVRFRAWIEEHDHRPADDPWKADVAGRGAATIRQCGTPS